MIQSSIDRNVKQHLIKYECNTLFELLKGEKNFIQQWTQWLIKTFTIDFTSNVM